MKDKNNIVLLPRWKNNATAAERLTELAQLAEQQPQLFGKMAVVYVEHLPNGNWKINSVTSGSENIFETIGIMQAEIDNILRRSSS